MSFSNVVVNIGNTLRQISSNFHRKVLSDQQSPPPLFTHTPSTRLQPATRQFLSLAASPLTAFPINSFLIKFLLKDLQNYLQTFVIYFVCFQYGDAMNSNIVIILFQNS